MGEQEGQRARRGERRERRRFCERGWDGLGDDKMNVLGETGDATLVLADSD